VSVKVLRIIARLNIGGPAIHAVLLTAGLDKERFDSSLAYGSTEPGEGDMSYLADESWVKRFFVPELGRSINPLADLTAFVKVYSIMKRERPHIVHTHTAKAGTIGRLAAVFAGVPAKVHTFHGHVFYGYFNKFAAAYFLFIERVLACFTDRIVAISQRQKDELLNKYRVGSIEKYRVVNLGLDLERFKNIEAKEGSFRRRFNFKKDDILVGIIGRLVPIKNHRMFIRAAKQLKKHLDAELFDKVKFVIVGDGPEREALCAYAVSEGAGSNIVFTGWARDIDEAYADIDIVALTSRNEGTPVSLIEAFASGKPVVATDVGGVRDVVGEIGAIVDKDDDAAFAQCLSELIMSGERRSEIGRKGRESVIEKFSKDRLISDTEKLYEELLTEKGIKA
jgi:glycosyltransferase involved in cell wall biosynthesis